MIVAFDTSPKNTGWVRAESPTGPVTFGSFGIAEANPANLGRLQYEWALQAKPLMEGCERVYFEAPIVPHGHMNFTTQRQLWCLTAHVEYLAFRMGLDCCEISPGAHKALIYEHGGAKPENACEYAAAWGIGARNADEADAVGIFLKGISIEYPYAFRDWLTLRGQSPPIQRVSPPKKPTKDKRTGKRPRRARPEPGLFDGA